MTDFATINNKFGLKLTSALTNNHVISPFSISFIMMLLHLGATYETKDELSELMNISDGTNERLNSRRITDMIKNASLLNKSDVMTISNGFYIRNLKEIQPDFLKLCQKLGKCESLSNGMEEKINKWIEESTKGLIQNVLEKGAISNLTKIIAINTIYFKSSWKYPFNSSQTRKRTFKRINGDKVSIDFMNCRAKEEFGYYENSKIQILEMFYKNSNFCFNIILPKKTKKVLNERSEIDIELHNISDFTDSIMDQKREIIISIPKFTMETKLELVPIFKDFGCNRMSLPIAEFDEMFEKRDINIDRIIHQAVIIVDEQGTEAAAVTVATNKKIGMRKVPTPIIFNAKRTFQFFLRHIPSDLVIFSGIFNGN